MIRLEPAGAEALLLVLGEQAEADLPLRIAALAERAISLWPARQAD